MSGRTYSLLWTTILLVILFHYSKLSAQDIFYELSIDPQPPVYAFEWEQHPEIITLYITNLSSQQRPVVLKGRLFNSAGDLIGETDNTRMPLTILEPNLNIIYPIEFVPSSALIFYGDFAEQIARTNRIPEGVYQLCVELLDPEIFNPIAPVQCGTFFVQGYDPPFLVHPPDGYNVTADGMMNLIFQWTPVNPLPGNFMPYYRFGLYEVFEGQAPREAILSNPPIYEELVSGETQLIWPPEIILPPSTQDFVWSVQALNQELQPMTSGDGWSEPFMIHVMEDTNLYAGDTTVTTPKELPPVIVDTTGTTPKELPPVIVDTTGTTPKEIPPGITDTTGTTPKLPPPGIYDSVDTRPKIPPVISDSTVTQDTVITEPPIPHISGDFTTPVNDTIYPGVVEFPTERVPPDTIIDPIFCGPDFLKEPGIPIDVGMVLENPDIFPYPRAVPLRAEGIDWDYAIFKCTGCGSDAKFYKAVEDHVNIFNWKLEGPGSLNTPFDLKAIKESEDSLKNILKRLREINDSLDFINNQIDSVLPGRIADAEKKLEDKNKELSEKDSLLTVLRTKRDSVGEKLDSIAGSITKFNSKIETWLDSIQARKAQIDSLQGILDGKPNQEMLDQLELLENLREQAELLKQQLEDKENEIASTGEELARAVFEADSAVAVAAMQYQSLRDQTEELAKSITGIETSLMADPDYREFLTRKREWNNKVNQFTGEFHSGETIAGDIYERQTAINIKATDAISVANPLERQERFQEYLFLMSSFKLLVSGSCNDKTGEELINCITGSGNVIESSDGYTAALDTLAGTSYVFDRTNDEQQDSLRQLLAAMENSVEQARSDVEEKAAQAEDARNEYVEEMNRLEDEKINLMSGLSRMTDSIAAEEIRYEKMRRDQADSLETHRGDYLASIHESRLRIQSFEQNITGTGDSLSSAIADSLTTSSFKKELDRQVESSETYRNRLNDLIDNLNKLIDDLKEKIENLKMQKARLEKEKEELEKEKEKKEKKKKENLTGNKTASGVFVYYIPPPLEEVMKNKPEFERLKKEVEKAEDTLKIAYDFKQLVQSKLVKEIEKIARSLKKFGELDTMISNMEQRKSDLDAELAALKNNKTIENQDKQLELQRILDEAEQAKEKAENSIEEYEQDSVTIQEDIESLKESIEEKDTLIAELERDLLEKAAQLKYDGNQLENARKTLEGRTEELTTARNELNTLEESLGRAKNDLTRAHARNDQAGINAADQEIQRIQSEITSAGTRITSLESSVASAASSLKSAQLRVKNGEESFNEVLKNISDEKEARRFLEEGLINKNEEMEEALSGLEHWRKTRDKAENLADKTNDAREKLQEDISEGINSDEEVAAMKEEIDGLDERISDAEKAKTDQVNAIEASAKKKDKIIDEADDKLKAAQDKLEKAESDLKEFLINEFEKVDFKVSLELRADDQVIDGYRYNDPEEKTVKQLIYPAKRVPLFENDPASGSLPDITLPDNCFPVVTFTPAAPPLKSLDPVPGREPRTIALIYKEGRPLWKQWPVLKPVSDLIAKDVVPVDVGFTTDVDQKIHVCMVQETDCRTPPPDISGIVDLGMHQWDTEGTIISQNPHYNRIMWEPPIIPRPYPELDKKLECYYFANGLAADPPPDAKSKNKIKPGMLLEVTDSIVGTPESTDTVIARVVTGDHKGLAGEDVEFSLVREAGEAENYGFDGKDSLKVIKTDGDGYAKVGFNYGKGFAKFKIYVKWKRGDKVIEEDESKAVCPITLQFLRFSGGVSTEAWEAALELFEGGAASEDQIEEMAAGLNEGGEEPDSVKDLPVHAIVGLIDHEKDFLEDEVVKFDPPENITLDPDSATTKSFGLARTEVKDLPPDTKVKLTATVQDKYKPLGRPGKDDSELSTTKIDRFKIGTSDNPFVILLDDPVSEGEIASGTGKLGAEIADGLMISLKDISLNINDVELEGSAEEKIAISGSVSYAGNPGVTANILGFELTLDSLVITASMGAGIGGTIRTDSMETAAKFYAEMEPSGDFLGTIKDLPELKIGGFKLLEGASFSVDMHTSKSPPGFESEFKGVIIHSASVELPEAFNTNEGATPSRLHAEDLYIGSSGIGGTVSYSGTLLNFAFAGYGFEVDSVMIEFKDAEVKKAALSGSISLPSPMEGKINATIGKAGSSWSAEITTDDPVSLPRLATAFTLMEGTGLEYNSETGIATFNLDAVISSEDYGDITIRDFKINSKGEVSASDISINKAIEFGSGFSLMVNSLSFMLSGEEYNLTFKGGFSFPLIGAEELTGTVTINPGPSASVKLDKAVIKFNRNPVDFEGSFEYRGNEFKGQFEITLENLKQIKGISGLLIIGNTEAQPDVTYTYWYAEIVLAGAVPLGQSGLSLLELGGGLGYNYNPPVGSQPGSPINSESFSFKAIIGMGTAPGGEIMAGRMEMILASGYFTLYGKLWILQQRESMYGEGRLSFFWAPENKLEGFVGMFIGIPNAEGEVLVFEGKINFLYSEADKYIRSEKIEGSFLHALNAKASVDVTSEHIKLDGELFYNLDKKQSLGIVTVKANINVNAKGYFYYIHSNSTLSAGANFHGDWDVDLDTPLGTADIISGVIDLMLQLRANPSAIDVTGSANVSWDIWIYEDSISLDVGYHANL